MKAMRMSFFRRRKRSHVAALAVALLVFGTLAWTQRSAITGWIGARPFRESLPPAQPVEVFSSPTGQTGAAATLPGIAPPPARTSKTQAVVPPSPAGSMNLAVPFVSQAPFKNWDQPYQDACEEATIIMIERYLRGRPLTPAEMDQEILRMVAFQESRYGFYRDSNAAETARLAEEYYPHLSARVVYDVTSDDIRAALVRGTPVLVLVDGRRLGNPFYTAPGPERHTLVIKGVKGDKFITHDPGTRRGADFVYPISTVMNAMVDYDGGTPGTGKRTMILLTVPSPG